MKARLEKDKRGIFGILIDKIDIVRWFRQKTKEFLERIGIKIPEKQGQKGKGFKH